jgi:hypothetical protein
LGSIYATDDAATMQAKRFKANIGSLVAMLETDMNDKSVAITTAILISVLVDMV